MSTGMRLGTNQIRQMPLHMQEQVGVEIAARMAQADPVAGTQEKSAGRKVKVRRLRFLTRKAARRYLTLRNLVRNGVIYDLVLSLDGCHCVCSFTYTAMEEC